MDVDDGEPEEEVPHPSTASPAKSELAVPEPGMTRSSSAPLLDETLLTREKSDSQRCIWKEKLCCLFFCASALDFLGFRVHRSRDVSGKRNGRRRNEIEGEEECEAEGKELSGGTERERGS